MKRKILVLMAVLMAAVSQAWAEHVDKENVKIGIIYYNLYSDGHAEVGKNSFTDQRSTERIIPETVSYGSDTYTVTAIGDRAFSGSPYLDKVVIPSTVSTIGECAFQSCRSLPTIEIPNSVTTIEGYAFDDCRNLTSIEIPNSVTKIGIYTFRDCTSLTSLVIPTSVTTIEGYAFRGCSKLSSISIPGSVTSIGEGAFLYCSSLETVTIPNGVTTIERDVFKYCSSLSSVTIPNSVTTIKRDVFRYCTSLSSVTIPNSVTSIGISAFDQCTSLETVTIPNSVTMIDGFVFCGCSKLSSVTIPGSVTSIGQSAFQDCTELNSITIPENVTSIQALAFGNCSKLKTIYVLTKSVPKIANNTFENTPSDMVIYVRQMAMNSFAKSWGWREQTLKQLPNIKYTTSDAVALGLTSLSGYGDDIQFIGDTYDGGCGYLEYLGEVTAIPADAFKGKTSLTSIDIPGTVTTIGTSAFNGCSALATINVCDNPARLGTDAFSGISSSHVVNVPLNGYMAYTADSDWNALNLKTTAGKLQLDDTKPYTIDFELEGCELRYTREVTTTNWIGVCLPYDLVYSDWGSQGYAAILTEAEGETLDWKVLESAGSRIYAGTPFIFKPNEAGTVNLDRTINATLFPKDVCGQKAGADYTLYGTFETVSTMATDGLYALSGNAFRQANNDGQTLKPYRVYIKANSAAKAPAHIRCRINGEEVTGIDGVEFLLQSEGKAYNLQGQPVGEEYRGIIIQNGKKHLKR